MEKADDFYSSDEDDTQSSTTASEIGGPKFKVDEPCNQPPDLWAFELDLPPHSCIAQAAVQDPSASVGIISWASRTSQDISWWYIQMFLLKQ